MFYGMITQREYFEDSVSVFVAIAPCALIKNPGLMTSLAAHNLYWPTETLTDLLGIQKVRNVDYYTAMVKHDICSVFSPLRSILPSYLCDWEISRD